MKNGTRYRKHRKLINRQILSVLCKSGYGWNNFCLKFIFQYLSRGILFILHFFCVWLRPPCVPLRTRALLKVGHCEVHFLEGATHWVMGGGKQPLPPAPKKTENAATPSSKCHPGCCLQRGGIRPYAWTVSSSCLLPSGWAALRPGCTNKPCIGEQL